MNEKSKNSSFPVGIATPIPRQPDGEAFCLHCTGGFRAAKINDGAWKIEPVLHDGVPSITGVISRAELENLISSSGLESIAFQNIRWMDGRYHSTWAPIIPKRKNHMRGPSDLWGSISTNLSNSRQGNSLNEISPPSFEHAAKIVDDLTREEALAQSISLSLRSMDISVEQIASFYNEQAVNLLASGAASGERSATSLDQTLFAHVHSFFLHLGAARDFLAAYLALKLGMDSTHIDDMTRLVGKLRTSSFGKNPILDLMKDKGFLVPKPRSLDKWEIAGWLQSASNLRRQFVHKRPYGSKLSEGFGRLLPVDESSGLFRYFHPIHIIAGEEPDVLDQIVWYYKNCIEFFQEAAEISGRDTSIFTLTADNIVSVEITRT